MVSLAFSRSLGAFVVCASLGLASLADAASPQSYDTSLFHAHPSNAAPENPARAFQTDEFTGSFRYAVRVVVPPGRAGATPELALNYASGGANGWLGVGWTLDVGHIERDTRAGPPIRWTAGSPSTPARPVDPLQYDDAGGFLFSFAGQSSRLVLVDAATKEYRAEIDRSQLRFRLTSGAGSTSRWEVVETSGAKHLFGALDESPHSQLSIPGSTAPGSARVARWALSSSTDTNGNRIVYEYAPQPTTGDPLVRTPLYLAKVKYNGHVTSPAFTHEVELGLENRGDIGSDDHDDSFSYRLGFRVETRKRLVTITPRVLIAGTWTAAREYRLRYRHSTSTGRSLLESIEERAGSGVSLAHPPMTFAYSEQPFEFESPIAWGPLAHQPNPGDPTLALEQFNAIGCKQNATLPTTGGSSAKVDLLDLDRDGLPDRVLIDRMYTVPGDPPDRYLVQHNRAGLAGTFDAALRPHTFAPYSGASYPAMRGGLGWSGSSGFPHCDLNDIGKSYLKLFDLNGDGFVDRVHDWRRGSTSAQNQLFVEYGFGRGFAAPVPFGPLADQTALSDANFSPTYTSTPWNSPEYVLQDCDQPGGGTCTPTVCPGAPTNQTIGALVATLADVNGDGLPDRVVRRGNETLAQRNHFLVQLNTGSGFEATFKRWSFDAPYVAAAYYFNNIMTFDGGGQATPKTSTTVGLFDLNGDGLPDRVLKLAQSAPNGWDKYAVQFNTGFGWTSFSAASPSSYFGPLNDPETPLDSFVPEAYGACSDTAPLSPLGPQGSFTVLMLQDVNADGLLDRVMQKRTPSVSGGFSTMYVQINRGTRFDAVRPWTNVFAPTTAQFPGHPEPWHYLQASVPYVSANDAGNQELVQLRDMNGDGLPDRVLRQPQAPYADGLLVQLASGRAADQLVTARNGLGARIAVEYEPATHHVNRNLDVGPDDDDPWSAGSVGTLSSPLSTVREVRTNDGLQTADSITRYDYYGGSYDFVEREFRGFYCVTRTDPAGTVSKTYFHQDGGLDGTLLGEWQDAGARSKRGMAFRTEVYAAGASQPLAVTVHKVTEEQLTPGVRHWFPRTSQTTTLHHEGQTSARATVETFDYYPANHAFAAQLDRHARLGEVTSFVAATHGYANATPADDLVRQLTYATVGGAPDIRDRIDLERWKDSSGAILRETDHDHAPITGNTIEVRRWLDLPATAWLVESFTHDAYGNVETHRRPADGSPSNPTGAGDVVTKRTTWDAVYHTFPHETIEDAGLDGLNFTTTTTHDPRSGAVLTSTDWNGVTTRNLYDAHYRLVDVSLAAPGQPIVWQQRYLYSFNGTAAGASLNFVHRCVNDGEDAVNGHLTWAYSDGFGRTVRAIVEAEDDRGFRVVDTRYDGRGHPVQVTRERFEPSFGFAAFDDSDAHTLTEFDALHRPVRLTPPGGDGAASPTGEQTTQFGYGGDPWVRVLRDGVQNTAGGGMEKREHRDAFGRVWKVEEVVSPTHSNTTTYEYDRFGALTRIVDARGNVTQFAYDSLGRRTSALDPDRGASTVSYFASGNVQRSTDARGNRTEHLYDHLGRVLRTVILAPGATSAEETLTYVYDANVEGSGSTYPVFKGQVFRIDDREGSTRHGYDIRGHVIRTRRDVSRSGASYVTRYEHDAVGKLRTLTFPGAAAKLAYDYDTGGNLRRIRALSGTGAIDEVFYEVERWNELRQPELIRYGNGTSTELVHYPLSRRLQSTRTTSASGVELLDLAYTYDAASNVRSIVDGVSTHAGDASGTRAPLHYDALYRLVSYTRPSAAGPVTRTFTYGALGNMLSNADMGPGAYTYPPSGPGSVRPHAVSSANGFVYEYDAAGNMTRRGPAGSQQSLEYDARNRLRRVVPATGRPTLFGYDASGTRLWKEHGDTRTVWIGEHYEERDGKRLCHVIADGRRICTFEPQGKDIDPVPVGQVPPEKRFDYYHADHLGSASVVTRRDGTVRLAYQYSAFGAETYALDTRAVDPTHLYSDQAFDTETGLYEYDSRYYDPLLGRFIQPDALTPDVYNPQALNPYSYVLNNPFRYIDPTGNDWWETGKNFVKGAVLGDFAGPDVGVAGLVGQVVVGMSPLGVLADLRDFAATGVKYARGEASLGDVFSAATDAVPGVSEVRKIAKLAEGAADVTLGVVKRLDGVGDAARGIAADAKFAQKTHSAEFGAKGAFAGRRVDDVAADLRSGAMRSDDVPINYIVRKGETIILNTRSAKALESAGIPRSQWRSIDRTGDALHEGLLDRQLRNNPGGPFEHVDGP